MKYILPLICICFYACQSTPQNQQNEDTQTPQDHKENVNPDNQIQPTAFNRYFEDEDETLTFFVQAENGETTTARIRTRGLEEEYDKETTIGGQFIAGHLLDLNADGFNELYLVYRLTDDSGNLGLIGIASNQNKDAIEITISDIPLPRQVNTDRIFASNGYLMRSFEDKNGALTKFRYHLLSSGNTLILEPKKEA